MKIWKLGASVSAVTSLVALVVHLQFSSAQSQTIQHETQKNDVWHFQHFDAWWPEVSEDCLGSASCVYLVIKETLTCEQDVLVEFTVTDDKDLFIDSQTKVIKATSFKSGQSFEIGTDTDGVYYFAIDQVTCGTGWDTTQHLI